MPRSYFDGFFTIHTDIEFLARLEDGGVSPWRTITLAAGDYWFSAFENAIEAAFHAHWELGVFEVRSCRSWGAHGWGSGGDDISIIWATPESEVLRDHMRFPDVMTVPAGAVAWGSRQPWGCWRTHKTIVDEAVSASELQAQDYSAMAVSLHHFGAADVRSLVFYADEAELAEAQSFWQHFFMPGRPVRWYRDAGIGQPWIRWTRPGGYRAYQAIAPQDWAPRWRFRGRRGHYEINIVLRELA